MADTKPKKLSEVLPEYGDWVRDAKAGSFKGIPMNTMSVDDLFAVCAVLNHICHEKADRDAEREKGPSRGALWTPPGFKKRK